MRGMQHSVNTAQEVIEQHHVMLLDKYFTHDGKAITKKILVNEDQSIDVPLISIVNQSSLEIDELELEFTASINDIDLKSLNNPDNELLMTSGGSHGNIDRTSFGVGFQSTNKKDNQLSVKIKFKTKKLPEGVCRIVDEFDKQVHPTTD